MIARLEEEAMAPKTKSKYRSLSHIYPTSVVVERLFSRAKLIMTPSSSPHGSNYTRDASTSPLQQGHVGPFTLDTVKASFISERETRKRAREEQLKAREEAVRVQLEQETKAAAEDSE